MSKRQTAACGLGLSSNNMISATEFFVTFFSSRLGIFTFCAEPERMKRDHDAQDAKTNERIAVLKTYLLYRK